MKPQILLVALLAVAATPSPSRARSGAAPAAKPAAAKPAATAPAAAPEIPFKTVARLHKLSEKGKSFSAKATYPTFRAQTRLTRFVNQKLRATERSAFKAWLLDTKTQLKEFQTSLAFEYQSAPSLSFYAPSRLISLRFDSYQFMGGAHGMDLMDARNFGLVNGQPKQFTLGDLFVPGFAYRPFVEAKIFAKLKKNEAATWVQDGSVKTLTTGQFNNFTISRSGVTWLFNQYEMGPYSNGQFEVTLSPQELGPGFKLKVQS